MFSRTKAANFALSRPTPKHRDYGMGIRVIEAAEADCKKFNCRAPTLRVRQWGSIRVTAPVVGGEWLWRIRSAVRSE